jgi:ADP-L-glycero-D-manno-heptose 6-epimerase
MKYTDTDFNEKSILITGGAGFIGSNVAFYIQKHYPKANIVVFDSFRTLDTFPSGNPTSLGHFKNLIGFNGTVISGDINCQSDIQNLKDNYKFDYIFHQAAISDTTVMDQKLMVQTNTNAFKDILDMAVEMGANVLYASSAGTYGNTTPPNRVGFDEEPENVYGFSKLMMDNIAYDYMKNYDNISIVGLRYFNVYGPKEYFKGKTASMILQLGLQILEGKNPKLFKYGEQQRDFVYIKDVVQANIKGATPKQSGVYNVGTSIPRTFNDIINGLKTNLDREFEVEYIDNPYEFYQNHTEADISKTKEFLDYEPQFTLEDGIKDYTPTILRVHRGIFS